MTQKIFLVSFSAILLLTACKKERIIIREVPQKRSWSLDSSVFGVSKILLSSFPLNDSVLVVGNANTINYINVNQIGKPISGAYINFNSSFSFLTAPRLSESIGVTLLSSNEMRVFNMRNPV